MTKKFVLLGGNSSLEGFHHIIVYKSIATKVFTDGIHRQGGNKSVTKKFVLLVFSDGIHR